MSAKTKPQKAAKVGSRPKAPKVEDPRRYVVVGPSGRQVYPGEGVTLAEAERLAAGLRIATTIVEVTHA